MKPCPECGSEDRKQSSGEYALLKVAGNRLTLDTTAPNTEAEIVRVTTCNNCGLVTLHSA